MQHWFDVGNFMKITLTVTVLKLPSNNNIARIMHN